MPRREEGTIGRGKREYSAAWMEEGGGGGGEPVPEGVP